MFGAPLTSALCINDVDFQMEFNNKRTADLIALAYEESDQELYWAIIAELHKRGSEIEFAQAKELTCSENPVYREIGADILGQLGFSKHNFQNESVEILTELLSDENEDVVASSAFSLGHRNDLKAVPSLINLLNHSNPRVRHGTVLGLSCLEDQTAIDGLIYLTNDENYDVRNWATFGLGSQCDMDTPDIRNALHKKLLDKDFEIRGEALVGLAKRNDISILNTLIDELEGEFNGNWAVEAAILLAHPQLCSVLKKLKNRVGDNIEDHFLSEINNAISACCK